MIYLTGKLSLLRITAWRPKSFRGRPQHQREITREFHRHGVAASLDSNRWIGFVCRGRRGDLLCVRTAGAYGFSMASNYNSRLRAAEVLVDGEGALLARERERYPDLVKGEHLPPKPRSPARRKPRR